MFPLLYFYKFQIYRKVEKTVQTEHICTYHLDSAISILILCIYLSCNHLFIHQAVFFLKLFILK